MTVRPRRGPRSKHCDGNAHSLPECCGRSELTSGTEAGLPPYSFYEKEAGKAAFLVKLQTHPTKASRVGLRTSSVRHVLSARPPWSSIGSANVWAKCLTRRGPGPRQRHPFLVRSLRGRRCQLPGSASAWVSPSWFALRLVPRETWLSYCFPLLSGSRLPRSRAVA